MEVDSQDSDRNSLDTTGRWSLCSGPRRIDAFNFNEFKTLIESSILQGEKWVALDFSKTEFMSILSIKFLSEVAEQLISREGGLALVAPSEKLKRQISIYASLRCMHIFKTLNHLK